MFKGGQYLDTVFCYGFEDEWLHDVTTEFLDPAETDAMLVKIKYKGERFDGLASNDGEPLTFGSKIQLDPNAFLYKDRIAEILADHGLEDESVHIREIVRTDIENDGIEEVFIIASNRDSSDKLKGRYSIAALQKVIDGKVETLFLSKQIEIMAPTDLNEKL